MIADAVIHPPRRYALLALVLVLPALGLAGLAGWAMRLDRAAATREAGERAGEIAQGISMALTNLLGSTGPEVVRDIEQGALPPSESGPDVLVLDGKNDLVWPIRGTWPPVPMAREGYAAAGSALDRAHALRQAGAQAQAVEAFHQALLDHEPDDSTESGLSVREVAAHAILEIVDGHADLLPEAWRSGDVETMRALATLQSTPISESAIERFQALIPILRQQGFITQPPGSVEVHFRRRNLVRRAYAALAEGRSSSTPVPTETASREWMDTMTFALDRHVWLAIRRPGWEEGGLGGGRSEVGQALEGRRVFALFRWVDLFEEARRTARTMDSREHFGISIRLVAPGLSVQQEEPSGMDTRATARWASTLPYGLGLSVAAALENPEAYFANQRQRGHLLGAAVTGAVGVSVIAAVVTWFMLVRQHRLGVQKSNFVASVSHELRAPLASVRLLADNLEHDRVQDPGRRGTTLRLIGRECRRLGALVDNVLDLSRIERRKLRIDPESTQVTSLIRETVRVAELGGDDRGVSIAVEVKAGAENLVATVDGQALQQAVSNLLDNALKHAPNGSTVTVGLELEKDPTWFSVHVSDRGPGIPAAERTRVFEPFHRLGSELRREHPGIGIGLAIVRHLVEAHGGSVWVEPAMPVGSHFVIRMPMGRDTESLEPPSAPNDRCAS